MDWGKCQSKDTQIYEQKIYVGDMYVNINFFFFTNFATCEWMIRKADGWELYMWG